MDKAKLEKLILQNKSMNTIAKELDCSVTTIKYWFDKHGLSTQFKFGCKRTLFTNCKQCNSETTNGKMYCSTDCKSKYHYKPKPNEQIQIDSLASKEKLNSKKRDLVLYKGNKCEICNYHKNYAALCFHHLDPNEKEFQISKKENMRKDIGVLRLEVDKCQLLCHNCHCEVHKQYENKNINSYTKQKVKSERVRKQLIDLKGSKCSVCGYSKNDSSLCFHHINPEEKIFNIDARTCNGYSLEKLTIEANKCLLLCHNCHMELHHPGHSR